MGFGELRFILILKNKFYKFSSSNPLMLDKHFIMNGKNLLRKIKTNSLLN